MFERIDERCNLMRHDIRTRVGARFWEISAKRTKKGQLKSHAGHFLCGVGYFSKKKSVRMYQNVLVFVEQML